eukprot:4028463-Prymnesium_polylepis.1
MAVPPRAVHGERGVVDSLDAHEARPAATGRRRVAWSLVRTVAAQLVGRGMLQVDEAARAARQQPPRRDTEEVGARGLHAPRHQLDHPRALARARWEHDEHSAAGDVSESHPAALAPRATKQVEAALSVCLDAKRHLREWHAVRVADGEHLASSGKRSQVSLRCLAVQEHRLRVR